MLKARSPVVGSLPTVEISDLDDVAKQAIIGALISAGYRVVEASELTSLPPAIGPDVVLVSTTSPSKDPLNRESTSDHELTFPPPVRTRFDEPVPAKSAPTLRVHAVEDEDLAQIAAAWVDCGLDPEALRGILSPTYSCEHCGLCEVADAATSSFPSDRCPGGGHHG